MLQRFQTLLLILSLALLFSVFFLPFIYLPNDIKVYCYEVRPLMIMNIITILLTIGTIALYKARMLQIRLSIFNTLILIAMQGWIAYYFFFDRLADSVFSITAVFPFASIILTVLAIRYIGRDEAIVRSLNRLRK